MNVSRFIAYRYLLSKSSKNAINFITLIATLGIIVGTFALFLVLSVFSGLEEYSMQFISAADPDIKITPSNGKYFKATQPLLEKIKSVEGVIEISSTIEERAFFNYKDKEQIAYLKGVDGIYNKVTHADTLLITGNWFLPNQEAAVVGNMISNKLGLGIYNYKAPFYAYVPKAGKGYISNPQKAFKKMAFQSVGIFSISEELDNKYVYVPIESAQELLGLENDEVYALEIKVNEEHELVAEKIKSVLGEKYIVKTKAALNEAFYKILNTEKLAAYLIFTLVIIVALFNLIGAMIMSILDKKNNLKTLFNLGATVKQIRNIFSYLGTLITFFGMLIGLILGTVLIYLQQKYQLIMITYNLPYPVLFKWTNLFWVGITILILGWISVKIATQRINKAYLEKIN